MILGTIFGRDFLAFFRKPHIRFTPAGVITTTGLFEFNKTINQQSSSAPPVIAIKVLGGDLLLCRTQHMQEIQLIVGQFLHI